MVKELAVIFPPIETELVPAEDEMRTAPSLVVDPIAPVKVMVPPVPAFKVRAWVPATAALMVPPKEIAPLPALVSIVLDPVKTEGTLFVIVKELAVIFPPIERVPPVADETRTAPSLVVPPRELVKVIAPADPAFKVRFWVPATAALMVPPKEIAPLFALVLMVLEAAKVVATLFVMVNELAVIFPPIERVPPVADEMRTAPSFLAPPIAPVKVIAPVDPAFKVRS
jgi:hypothetical protein